MFEVTVSLTVAGLANWLEVVSVMYAYLRLVATGGGSSSSSSSSSSSMAGGETGPPEWIHAEMAQMARLEYDYCDEEEDSDLAPPLELLPADDLLGEWGAGAVSALLSCLTPPNCHVQLTSSVFAHTPLARHRHSNVTGAAADADVAADDGDGEDKGRQGEIYYSDLIYSTLLYYMIYAVCSILFYMLYATCSMLSPRCSPTWSVL
jgi:hypothetical protein